MKTAASAILWCAALPAALPVFGQATAPLITDIAAARLLDQAAWGPTPADIQTVQGLGIQGWLNAQYLLNTSDIPDQPIINSTTGMANRNLAGC